MPRRLGFTVLLALVGCGGRIQGTATAPAGTTVQIFRQQDADEFARAVRSYNKAMRDSIDAGLARGLDRAAAEFNAKIAPMHPEEGGREVRPIGHGTVGADGRLAIDGRFHGALALVIDDPVLFGVAGCRVDIDMPRFGERTVTMAGNQCHLWELPVYFP